MISYKKVLILLLFVSLLLTGCSSGKTNNPDASGENGNAAGTNDSSNAGVTAPPAADEVEQMSEVNSNPLSDVRVRQAIAYAIDKQAIADSFFEGTVRVANSLTPDNELDLEDYSYDPEKAKQLLAEAGWDPNYVLKVVYTYTDQQTVDFMAILQQYLAAVGIKMEASLLEGDTSTLLWSKPEDSVKGPSAVDWDIYYGAIGTATNYNFYNRFRTGGPLNSHTPGNDSLNELIDKVNLTLNADEQKTLFDDIQIYMNKQLPALPLYHQDVYTIESNALNRNNASYGNEQYSYDWKVETWDITPNTDGEKVVRTNGGPIEYFWDPISTANGNMANKLLYDHLVAANGNCDSFTGQQAESYNISEDGLSISFVLKKGLKWHDGSEITPNDVKFTWELAARVPSINVLYTDMVQKLDGYKEYTEGTADELKGIVIDGNTITFNFTSPCPTAMMGFSQLPTLPEKYLKDADPLNLQQNAFFQKPVGSGPFKVAEVSMNNYSILEAFDDYHEGRPVIDKFYLYPSTETDANMVLNTSSGLYDYAWSKTLSDVQAIQKMDNYKVTAYPMLYTRLLYFNKFEK